MRRILPFLLMFGPYPMIWILDEAGKRNFLALILVLVYVPLCGVLFISHWLNAFIGFRNENAVYELAFWNMLIKIAHCPFYIMLLWKVVMGFREDWEYIDVIGMGLFMEGVLWSIKMSMLMLLLFCMYGVSALIKACRVRMITTRFAVMNGILHFCIGADVVSAIWLFLKIRKNKNLQNKKGF